MTVAEKQQENAKNAKISKVEGFTKSQPTGFDTDAILDKDDVIVMPSQLPEVFKQVFGKDADGNDIYAEFIVVDVEHPGKATRAVNFFPSSLTKNIWVSKKDEDGDIVLADNRPLNPKGTAVELYTSFQGKKGPNGETDMQLGMEALLSKKIKISDRIAVDVEAFVNGKRAGKLKKSYVLTYDLV